MRNQNYITNKKIIAEVKKNQKDYVEPKPPKKDLTLTATVESITVGENVTINVTGLEEATGNITATIGEKNYTGAIDKGNATITVPDLTEGNFTANISYAGDDKYNSASATVNITVNPVLEPPKKDLTLTATAESITVGEDATINVTGLEEATGNITATIGEKNYTGAIDKGNATITVPDLTEGNFTANISYAGDDKYNPASATVNITVKPKAKKDLTLSATAELIEDSDGAIVTVTGLETATGNVTITIDEETYTGAIEDGEATITIPDIIKALTTTVNYAGDTNYNPASTTIEIDGPIGVVGDPMEEEDGEW